MSQPLNYTDDVTEPRQRRRRFWHVLMLWLTFVPIVLATLASIIASLYSIEYRLRMPYPQNPWESSIVADAWRYAHGQRIYERIPEGHATHFYGPLMSTTIGAIFKVTNSFNLYLGRGVSLGCALLTCAILLHVFAPRSHPLVMLVAIGLLLSLHYRGRAYFVETRPDMVALLLATLSLVLFYHAHNRDLPWLYVPGVFLIVTAMLFKQTYAAAAAVPALAVLITHERLQTDWRDVRRQLILALIPLFAVSATIILMKTFAPVVYSYVIAEPAMYEVRIDRLGLATISLITLSPLFVAMAAWYALMPRDPLMQGPKMRWLIAALIVGCAVSLPVFAKRGGSYNSLLLGWVPTTAFCVAMLNPLLRRLSSLRGELIGVAAGWFITLLIMLTTFSVPNSDLWNFAGAHGGPDYREVIAAVHRLQGNVVCPDDPTILIAARNKACRSLEAELDATGRPGGVPEGLADELAEADWLVRVHGHHEDPRNPWWTATMMKELGFERQRATGPFRSGMYSLWKRVAPPTSQATSAPTRPKRRGVYTR